LLPFAAICFRSLPLNCRRGFAWDGAGATKGGRAMIAFFFFFFVPIPHQAAANVPPACANAITNYEVVMQRHNAENASKFEQIFGRPVGAIEPNGCPRAMPFYRWRLAKLRAIMTTFRAVYAACVGVSLTPRSPTPVQIIAILQQKLAEGRH
jgi:hypothetical protein